MKHVHYFFLVILLVSCQSKKSSPESSTDFDTTKAKKQVNKVLDDWHQAAAESNFEAYFEKMDETAVFIGTDATENWNKEAFKKFSKPYFDKGEAWSFKAIERNVYFNENGNTAWFDELLDTWMGVCRGSGVLQKINSTWIIKHYVLSVTVPNEKMKEHIQLMK